MLSKGIRSSETRPEWGERLSEHPELDGGGITLRNAPSARG
jgi:hypothetical protein